MKSAREQMDIVNAYAEGDIHSIASAGSIFPCNQPEQGSDLSARSRFAMAVVASLDRAIRTPAAARIGKVPGTLRPSFARVKMNELTLAIAKFTPAFL